MKISIGTNEWYPIYELEDLNVHGEGVEVSDEDLQRIHDAFSAFQDIQTLLGDLYGKQA